MSGALSIRAAVEEILGGLARYMTDFVPRLFTAIVIILVGWLIALVIRRAMRTLLGRLRFDSLLERIGIVDSLKRVGVQRPPSRWVPRLIFYLILVLFIRTGTQLVGLTEISGAIDVFFSYLPSVFAAVLIVLFGNTLGQFLGRAVTVAAKDSGIDYAPVLGKLVAALVFLVVTIMAIGQLKIDVAMVNSVVLIIFGAFGLTFALSFGLGTREITRNIVAGFYARRTFPVGEQVEIQGRVGVLKEITPVMTILESEGRTIALSNSAFVEAISKK